jgi:raffinose/stachyose/melibiose transport system substrate-binding protein
MIGFGTLVDGMDRYTKMARNSTTHLISLLKRISLVLVMAVFVWVCWPPAAQQTATSPVTAEALETTTTTKTTVKYVLKVFPSAIYMPGTRPMDVGKPLTGMRKVADQFERLYPDTHIEFINVPNVREWLVTQLAAGTAPDILHVNVGEVWQDVQKGWYVALDPYLEQPNPFIPPGQPGSKQWWDVFKYQTISRGKAGPDGKTYCICIDMVESGIFYNKTVFRKLGLSEPRTWTEFTAVQARLKQAGYTPMIGGTIHFADWGLDLIFDQFYHQVISGIDLREDSTRGSYMKNYLDWDEICFLHEQGYFTAQDARWREVWRILKQWRGYYNKNLTSPDLLQLFLTQKGAMLWELSTIVNKLARDAELNFEWGVFYPPPVDSQSSALADGHPMCAIGGAAIQLVVTNSAFKDTGDPATSERLRRCIAFLQYLTTPAADDQVVNELTCFLPNVKGVNYHPALAPFDGFLRKRYTTTKWLYTFDLRFSDILFRLLDLYLNDGIDEPGFLKALDRNISAACQSARQRHGYDRAALQAGWNKLAPLRAADERVAHVH